MFLRITAAAAALVAAGVTAAVAQAATLNVSTPIDCSSVSVIYEADQPGQTFTLASDAGTILTTTLDPATSEFSSIVSLPAPFTTATFRIIVGGQTVATAGPIACALPPPPVPAKADQCKKGGWRDYGIFRNQGDCVSFVATKGKNPPASSSR
jgi:hypothetical protein